MLLNQKINDQMKKTINSCITKLGISETEQSVEKNNNSILKILDALLQTQSKELSGCFYKIKNLASELNLADGFQYLSEFFTNIVSSLVYPALQH